MDIVIVQNRVLFYLSFEMRFYLFKKTQGFITLCGKIILKIMKIQFFN